MKTVVSILFIILLSQGGFSQCIETLNLSQWSQEGDMVQGMWTVSGNNESVSQVENLGSTYYVSSDAYMNAQLKGTIRVNTDADNDIIGFVFGYNNPTGVSTQHDYWLFLWKQGSDLIEVGGSFQTNPEGFSLIRVNGTFTQAEIDTAVLLLREDSRFSIIETKHGSAYGWEDFYDYNFQLDLSPTKANILINNDTIFSVSDCFNEGRFGFFNYSQANAVYSNFNYDIFTDFTIANVCAGEEVQPAIDNATCVMQSNFSGYSWSFGDGGISTLKQPSHIYSTGGEYSIQLTVSNAEACTKTVRKQIQINETRNPLLEYGTTVCASDSFLLNAGSGYYSYLWQDGSTDTTFTARSTGTFTVQVEGECGVVEGSVDISINEVSTASLGADIELCENAIISIDGQIENGTPNWITGGGTKLFTSQATSLRYVPTSAEKLEGEAVIVLQALNGCNDASDTIIVSLLPVPVIDAGNNTAVCKNVGRISLAGNANGANNIYWSTSETVEFGRNVLTPTYTFTDSELEQDGLYIYLTAEAQGTCTEVVDSLYLTLTPAPTLAITEEIEICPQASELRIGAEKTVATSISWSGEGSFSIFGDSAIYRPTANQLMQESFYIYARTAGNGGCIPVSDSSLVLVVDSIDMSFTVTPITQKFPKRKVLVENRTPGIWNVTWDFGDGNIAENKDTASNLYAMWGTYDIVMELENTAGCIYSKNTQIEIIPLDLYAGFDSLQSGCAPYIVRPVNTSRNANKYSWSINGVALQESWPRKLELYPGLNEIVLVAENSGATDTMIQVVEVYPQPFADFDRYPGIVDLANANVTFSNNSEDAVSYIWDFGDGSTSNEVAPNHKYSASGMFDVELISISDQGCSDTILIDQAVDVRDECHLIFPTALKIGNGGAVRIIPGEHILHDDIFVPLSKNIVDYRLDIYDRWGELIFQSTRVNVGWNGYIDDSSVPVGTYIYTCTATCQNGRIYEQKGSISVIK